MNNCRRNKINSIKNLMMECKEMTENVLDEEQNYFDNIPENLLSSDRAMNSEDAISTIEDIIDSIDNIIDMFDEVLC